MNKRVVRPFILPPTRKSTGKADIPVLVKWIGNTFTGPLNDRLQQYVHRSHFPDEAVECHFKIEPQGNDLFFRFSVNGQTEEFVLNDWRTLHGEESLYRLRALPWKIFQRIFQALDRVKIDKFLDDDFHVNVYPIHMHPAPRGIHDFTYFPACYWLVLEAWQHAKKVYKSNRAYSTWQQTVKHEVLNKLAASPASNDLMSRTDDHVLQTLIGRLEKPRAADELVAMQERIRDRRIPATAEELALDHAAHLCGVPLYEYTVRHLKTLKSDKQQTAKTLTTQERADNFKTKDQCVVDRVLKLYERNDESS